MRKILTLSAAVLGLLIPAIPSADAGIFCRRQVRCSSGPVVVAQGCYQAPVYVAPAVVTPYVAPVVTPTVVVNNNVPAYTPDWKTEILRYAAARDDQQAYLLALGALGFQTNFNAASVSQTYGATGQTQYGYSYQSAAAAYGQLDLNALYQQSARLTQGAQALSGQANTEFGQLVAQAGQNQARVAEILAKAAAAERVLHATDPQASTTTIVAGQQTQINPAVLPPPQQDASAAEVKAFMTSIAIPACASCHSGQNVQGRFDISQYPAMSLEQKQAVWGRIMSADPDKRMPKVADGAGGFKPGVPLPAEVKRAFFTH